MNNLNEIKQHHLRNIEFTEHQKTVLAKAVLAGAITEPVRVKLHDEKLVSARDMLDELGIIDYSPVDKTIKIEDESIDLMKMEGIIDDTQQLTPEAQALAQNGDVQETITFSNFFDANLLLLN
jgi:hypothetical protein